MVTSAVRGECAEAADRMPAGMPPGSHAARQSPIIESMTSIADLAMHHLSPQLAVLLCGDMYYTL